MHPHLYKLLKAVSLTPAQDDRAQPGCVVLLTPDETAMRLRVAKQTLAKWRMMGCGPRFVRVGGNRVAYPTAEVDAWWRGRLVGSTAGADTARSEPAA